MGGDEVVLCWTELRARTWRRWGTEDAVDADCVCVSLLLLRGCFVILSRRRSYDVSWGVEVWWEVNVGGVYGIVFVAPCVEMKCCFGGSGYQHSGFVGFVYFHRW